MPVAVLVFDARVGKLDVAIVVRELVLDGPTMDLFRRAIGPSVALGLAAIALLQELLVLALQLVVEETRRMKAPSSRRRSASLR